MRIKYTLLLLFAAGLLIFSACGGAQNTPDDQTNLALTQMAIPPEATPVPETTTVCAIPSDFAPAPTGQYSIGGDAREGTITYIEGVINIFDEEGTLVATDNADANGDYDGTTNQRDVETGVITKIIDIIVCKGHLFIRETVPPTQNNQTGMRDQHETL